jgi:predicted RNA binding protein YcfA (HicA-like mRNA interferase family)
MTPALPQITGRQLLDLLKKDGWEVQPKRARHGEKISKSKPGSPTRLAIIPTKPRPLPKGTLSAILSHKQTGLGMSGLLALVNKYGI